MFIEQIMIFALGFLVAGLLSLLFLPAFWRRAMTLSRRQLEMQMPLSMTEIVAERDQLRAEFAAEQRRLEQRLALAQQDRAAAKLAFGQRGIDMVKLEDALAATRREAAETSALLATAERSIASAEAELSTTAKQLYDTDAALERRNAAFAELIRRHDALSQLSDEQRMMIAGLETRLSGELANTADLARRLEALRVEATDAREAQRAVARERDQFHADARAAHARRDALQGELEELARRMEERGAELRRLEREKTRLQSEHDDQARALREERERNLALLERLAGHDRELRAYEEKAAAQADLARAGQAALEGALAAQRRETEAERAEIAALRDQLRLARSAKDAGGATAISPDYPALRRAIAAIGAEIATLAEEKQALAARSANRNAPAQPSAAE